MKRLILIFLFPSAVLAEANDQFRRVILQFSTAIACRDTFQDDQEFAEIAIQLRNNVLQFASQSDEVNFSNWNQIRRVTKEMLDAKPQKPSNGDDDEIWSAFCSRLKGN